MDSKFYRNFFKYKMEILFIVYVLIFKI